MKTETKRGLAIVGSLVGTGLAIWGVTRVKAAPPVVCTPGDEKCIGSDWCQCNPAGSKWIVLVKDSPTCIPVGAAVLYGTVTNIETGVPIEGILVDCGGYTDTTAPDGSYRIEDVPPGEYSVFFTDPLSRYEPLTI